MKPQMVIAEAKTQKPEILRWDGFENSGFDDYVQ